MVFLDSQGNHIYAEIPEKNVDNFMDRIEEGKIYDIRKLVFPRKYVFRRVEGHSMIKFTRNTEVVERTGMEAEFPFCTYALTPIAHLPRSTDMPERFTDVIGMVTGVSEAVQYVSANRTKLSTKRVIHLKDLIGHQITVILWGEAALNFEADEVVELDCPVMSPCPPAAPLTPSSNLAGSSSNPPVSGQTPVSVLSSPPFVTKPAVIGSGVASGIKPTSQLVLFKDKLENPANNALADPTDDELTDPAGEDLAGETLGLANAEIIGNDKLAQSCDIVEKDGLALPDEKNNAKRGLNHPCMLLPLRMWARKAGGSTTFYSSTRKRRVLVM